MFTVKITALTAIVSTSTSKSFSSADRARRCYNANKGEGVNVILLDASGNLMEGSKTF